MSDANRISAEYLLRRVETVDWQAYEDAADLARPDDYVSPLRFAAGFVVLGLVAIAWAVIA